MLSLVAPFASPSAARLKEFVPSPFILAVPPAASVSVTMAHNVGARSIQVPDIAGVWGWVVKADVSRVPLLATESLSGWGRFLGLCQSLLWSAHRHCQREGESFRAHPSERMRET